jgi:TonB family protein
MKFIALLLAFSIAGVPSFAQQKYFEGELAYRVSVTSRIENLTDKEAHKLLAMGDMLTIVIKDGNYRQTTDYSTTYIIKKDKKEYFKFRTIDTLYYLDYSSDTSHVTAVLRSDSVFKVGNYPCKAITIRTGNLSRRYYYSNSLFLNPEFDKENTIGHYNEYSRETNGAVYLFTSADLPFAYEKDSCVRVEQKNIDDRLFDLPALPLKKIDFSKLMVQAHFPGKAGAWLKYLEGNLNGSIAGKYIKLPKGQSTASLQVMVQFDVAEDGSVSDIQVLNKKEVHPKLAEEAIRVIRESPRWVPTNVFGEKISGSIKQPIVFQVKS